MAQEPTVAEIVDAFGSINGVNAQSSELHDDTAWIEVTSESAIGQFYGTARKLDAECVGFSRASASSYVVMDGWVGPKTE